VRHRDQAGFLDLVGGGEKFVIGGGHGGHTGFFQHVRVGPHEVDAMHIDRHGDIAAFVLHHVSHHLGQQAVPLLGLGGGVQVGQHALARPFLNRRALDLRGSWWVARHHAAFQYRGCVVAAAAGHRKVFPDMAFGLHDFFQFGNRLGLTARGPVMQHFDFAGHGSRGAQNQGCGHGEF